MTREPRGSFGQRLAAAGLSPQQREDAAAVLLLAELVDELCSLLGEQIGQLAEQNDLLAEQNDLLADIRSGRSGQHRPAVTGDEGTPGGEGMRITEPDTPPPDHDEQPDDKQFDGGRALAGTPARSAPASGPAAKTAAGASPAKKTTTAAAARRRGTTKRG